jgi:hypothetical protein
MSDRQNPLNAVDEIYTNPEPIVEFVKMQIGFWEKLVVLDAATLAASFTASGIFREHFTGDGGVGYLATALEAPDLWYRSMPACTMGSLPRGNGHQRTLLWNACPLFAEQIGSRSVATRRAHGTRVSDHLIPDSR